MKRAEGGLSTSMNDSFKKGCSLKRLSPWRPAAANGSSTLLVSRTISRSRETGYSSVCMFVKNMYEERRLMPIIREIFMKTSLKILFLPQ